MTICLPAQISIQNLFSQWRVLNFSLNPFNLLYLLFSASRIRLRLKLYAHKLFFTLRCYQEIYNLQMRNLLFSSMATLALRSYLNILKFSSMLGHEFGILKCSYGILESILIIRYLKLAKQVWSYVCIYFNVFFSIMLRLLCRPRDGMSSIPCMLTRSSWWFHVSNLVFMPKWNSFPATNIQLWLVVWNTLE